MKTLLIYFWLFWVGITAGCAQNSGAQQPGAQKPVVLPPVAPLPLDSLGKPLANAPRRFPVRWTLNLDFRDSFIDRRHVHVWGVNTGIVFGPKRHQITLGYYWLTYNSYLHLIDLHRNAAKRLNLAYYTKTDMAFGNVMFWPNLINNRRWMFSTPVEIGAGRATAVSADIKTGSATRSHWDFFMPVQLGVYAQYKATRWIGVNAQVGYRLSIFRANVNQHYNGTYYSIGTVIYPEFFKDMWGLIRHRQRPAKSILSAPAIL